MEKETTQNQPETFKSKKWLQKLKDESWEAELLVSAIAIFGTFQLFKVVDWSANKFIDILAHDQYMIGYFIVFFGLFAVSVLVSMFVIHFFLRAYWIGLVGLNSVFSDYSVEDSAYSKIYTKKLIGILPKLKNSIQKVDELCSVIFSAAFAFLLMYLYIALFASAYLFMFNLLSDYVSYYLLLIPIAILFVVYMIQMIIGVIANLKTYKENDTLQLWYFKIVKLGSILMLGPLYKSILQITMIFASNFKKKKAIIYLIITFLFSGIFIAAYQVTNTNIMYLVRQDLNFNATKTYAGYYKTENENMHFLLSPEITSDVIQANYLKIFIPVFSHEDKLRQKVCGTYIEDENKSKTEQRKEAQLFYLNCYQKYNHVFLNDKKVAVKFLKYYHPRTKQFGVVGYINLSNTAIGENNLKIKKDYGDDNTTEWVIPFQYFPKQ